MINKRQLQSNKTETKNILHSIQHHSFTPFPGGADLPQRWASSRPQPTVNWQSRPCPDLTRTTRSPASEAPPRAKLNAVNHTGIGKLSLLIRTLALLLTPCQQNLCFHCPARARLNEANHAGIGKLLVTSDLPAGCMPTELAPSSKIRTRTEAAWAWRPCELTGS